MNTALGSLLALGIAGAVAVGGHSTKNMRGAAPAVRVAAPAPAAPVVTNYSDELRAQHAALEASYVARDVEALQREVQQLQDAQLRQQIASY